MTGDDLDILDPDHTVTVGGEAVVVRELRFGEALRLAPLLEPLVAALQGLFARHPEPELSELLGVLGGHGDAVMAAMATSTGRDAAWLEGLSDEDGEALLYAWWGVNMGFFVRRVVVRQAAARQAGAAGRVVDGAGSSPAWPATATTPNACSTTPPAS